jgi:hypothetical protein
MKRITRSYCYPLENVITVRIRLLQRKFHSNMLIRKTTAGRSTNGRSKHADLKNSLSKTFKNGVCMPPIEFYANNLYRWVAYEWTNTLWMSQNRCGRESKNNLDPTENWTPSIRPIPRHLTKWADRLYNSAILQLSRIRPSKKLKNWFWNHKSFSVQLNSRGEEYGQNSA